MSRMNTFTLRAARPDDVPALVGLIGELAAFENLTHLMQVSPQTLAPYLFGPRPVAEAWVAEVGEGTDAKLVALALCFTNFSTFLGKPGLYLEDLYVQPAHRNAGIGRALLQHLAGVAVARDYGRFEWCVLDWNVNAQRFYERLGATLLNEWRLCRVTGDALRQLGQGAGA
ncbi:acetyltransferase [Burkholderiales bacterium JOSHI_001]|nr:acetyltransferase [Burkholderiales bacterium JOSHI_001]